MTDPSFAAKFAQAKRQVLQKMLDEDSERILKFINDGDDLKDIPMGDPAPIEDAADADHHTHVTETDPTAPDGYATLPDE